MRKFIFTTVLLFVVMLTFGTIPNSGLIGYWPFSGNANDASGHGHNGIVANAKLTTDKDNKANSAYSFSGNGTITVPYHKDFDFSKCKQYSYGCWIYNNTSGNQVYMGKDAPGCQNISFNIQQESTCIFTTGMHGSSCWNTYTSNKSLGVNQWHHVLVSVDSLSLSIYIDGKFINKNQMITPMWGDYVSDIVFGAWSSYHGNERFVSGKIDDVVLYNRAITPSEVTALYEHGVCNKPLTVQDTAVFKICDAKFQVISPKLYFVGTDTVKSKCGCDSIINRYIKYQYATDCCPSTTSSLESLTIKATTPVGTVTINVYPNPTKDHVKVECLDYAKIENYQVRLVSSTSMILWSAVINQSSFEIDMTTIPQGVYLIEVFDNQGNNVDFKKIVKL